MRDSLVSLNKELDGVDLVLEKLVTKANVSVFEKLSKNCNRIFNTFCELSIEEIVKTGNSREAIAFLTRLKDQVSRLSEYKENLIAYIEMEKQTEMPSVSEVQRQQDIINLESSKEKNLTLFNSEGKAA